MGVCLSEILNLTPKIVIIMTMAMMMMITMSKWENRKKNKKSPTLDYKIKDNNDVMSTIKTRRQKIAEQICIRSKEPYK